MRNLVVYYSKSGNTETVAKEISKAVNGELIKIELIKDISFGWAAFTALLGLKGKIKTINCSIEDYDNIFIGSPVWAGKNSTPMNTYLNNIDFTGKNIFIFITQADDKTPSSVYDSIAARVIKKGGNVIDTFFIQTNIKEPLSVEQTAGSIIDWINKNRSIVGSVNE